MPDISVINIGNTHVQIACAGILRSVPTEEFNLSMLPAGPCAAASVVPAMTARLSAARPDIFWVNCHTPGIPDLSCVEAEKLGADRIANAFHLKADGILPAMTFDCGTAINCEIVNEHGAYVGGAILPGRKLLRRSLKLFTAQLPEIPLYSSLPEMYPGTGTGTDLRWGTDGLLLAGIRDLRERTRALFPGKPLRIVFCGGDGAFFAAHFADAELAKETFTLDGIRALYEFNAR